MPCDTPPSLLDARYAAPQKPPAGWNKVLETLLAHRSVRSFLPDALPEGTLELLVAAAQSAASSSNLHTWSVLTVDDPARRERLAALSGNQRHIVQAPLFLVWLADLSRANAIGRARGVDIEGTAYLEMLFVAMIDAALAAQNAVAAAESLGLGTVYIGSLRNDVEAVARDIGLPPQVMPVFGLCVGYPDPAVPTEVKPRPAQRVVLHRERYTPAEQADIASYAAAMDDFQRRQRMPEEDWRDKVVNRLRSAASLTGRHRMREALAALGFPLR